MNHFTRLIIAMTTLLISHAAQVFSQPVTGLQAFSFQGQVFLTFNEVGTGTTYKIYRSPQPITSVSGMTAVAALKQGSGANPYNNVPFVIPNVGTLAAGTGLLVYTTDTSGTYHYAITNSTQLDQNVPDMTVSVAETTTAVPGAVLMKNPYASPNTANTMVHEYYAWENYASWDHTKSYYGWQFNVVVPATMTPGQTYPLTVVLHPANGSGYVKPDTTGSTAEVTIHPDDNDFLNGTPVDPYTGRKQFFSGWFGYKTGNIAYNYTERRIMRYIELIASDVAQYQIDRTRIYAVGASMGGGGAMHLVSHYPHVFAAAEARVGWVDFHAWGPPGSWSIEYGAEPGVPVCDSQGPAVWNWENLAAVISADPLQFPPIIHAFSKNDNTVFPTNYPNLLTLTESHKFAMMSQWRQCVHAQFSLTGTIDSAGQVTRNSDYRRFKLDEPYPAFANALNSKDADYSPNPQSTPGFCSENDDFGQRNLLLDWSSSLHDLYAGSTDTIVDTPNSFQMTFKSLSATDTNATVTIRNAHHFRRQPGQQNVAWQNHDLSGNLLGLGTVNADERGLVTVDIAIKADGNRLSLSCTNCPQAALPPPPATCPAVILPPPPPPPSNAKPAAPTGLRIR